MAQTAVPVAGDGPEAGPGAAALPAPGPAPSLRASRGAVPRPLRRGAEALVAAVATAAKDYEMTAEMRDADGPMLDRALEIVRRFIAERRLVLFGGLAIDCALRLRGARIYPDAQRPDYDCLSPRSVDDAYDLADRLAAAGFAHVGAVRGIHVQTTRVRVDFRWVADLGHAPAEVYATIPTFDYQDLRVVHPDFQRMDMHLAFCFPYSGAPREDVFHRWRKDLKRLNLFEAHYPTHKAAVFAARPAAGGPARPRARARLAVPVVGGAERPGVVRGAECPGVVVIGGEETATAPAPATVAVHGFAAYALLRAALGDEPCAAPRLAVEFPDPRTVEVETPVAGDGAVVFASPWPAAAVGDGDAGVAGDAPQWFNPYMDVYPESVRHGTAVVLSTAGRLLAASSVAAGGGRVRVVSAQYLLLWLLCEAHRAAPAARAVYREYYGHTLAVLRAAEAAAARALEAAATPAARAAALDAFAAGPFAPTVETIGDANTDAAYVVRMADVAARLGEAPPAVLRLPPGAAGLLEGLPPRGYYPSKKGRPRPPPFDYDACRLFQRDGRPRARPP